jgi:hypothetical protein
MSETVAAARVNIRYHLNDTEPGNFAISSMALDRIILNQSVLLGARVGTGAVWTESVVTLTANSLADYTLGSPTQMALVATARINATGQTMERVSFDEINAMREGMTSTSQNVGDPQYFALWETTTPSVKMRINSVPSAARTIDFLISTMPVRTVSDTTTLPFSDLLLAALEYKCAALAVKRMPAAVIERLNIAQGVVEDWQALAESAIRQDRERQDRIARRGYGVGVF